MADFWKGAVNISQASTSFSSCSQSTSLLSSSISYGEEDASYPLQATWKQKEMLPEVTRLLHFCNGLWDSDVGITTDRERPEVAAKLAVAVSTDPENAYHDVTLPPEPGKTVMHSPRDIPSSIFWDNGNRSRVSIPCGKAVPAPSLGESMSNLPTRAAAASFMDKSAQGGHSATVSGFEFVPFYGCAGKSEQPVVYVEPSRVAPCAGSALQELSDSEDEGLLDDADAEVLVGPTKLAVKPLRLEDQTLPQTLHNGRVINVPLVSGPRCMSFSEAMRLSNAGNGHAPLSFGSVLHLNATKKAKAPCRPCMFERWAGRCSKGWLCDFCHLHVPEKQRRVAKVASNHKPTLEDYQWCVFGKRPKSL